MSVWVQNSETYLPTGDVIITYVTSVVALLVLIHSYFLHGTKYDSIRKCTDLTAISCRAH
jgi:hypothetical protein